MSAAIFAAGLYLFAEAAGITTPGHDAITGLFVAALVWDLNTLCSRYMKRRP